MKSRLKPVLLRLELAVAGSPGEGDDVAIVVLMGMAIQFSQVSSCLAVEAFSAFHWQWRFVDL